MEKSKRCSGCKQEKTLTNFYKNKLVLDGHSNYCIDCTRENSRRYFQRKKERVSKMENENLMKQIFISHNKLSTNSENAENLMKILMIEKMLNNVSNELENLKSNFVKSEEPAQFSEL
jgi:hypothetical protein